MIRLYHLSAAGLKLLLILLIIGGGIAVGIGRLLTPTIADYRGEIEQWTSQALGQQVTIGTIKGSWQGTAPKLILHDLALYSEGLNEPQLRFSEVHIAIGLVESLIQGRPAPSRITIFAPKLSITRQQDGSITVGGLKKITNRGDSSRAFLLPRRIDVQGGEITWQDLATNAPPLHLSGVELSLRNDGNRHQLEGSLVLPGTPSSRLQLAADLTGQPGKGDDWSADLYFKGNDLDLTELLNRRIPGDYRFQQGQADLELWSRWEEGNMVQIEGVANWRQFSLSRALKQQEEVRRLEFDGINGGFHWRRQPQGWRLDLADVELTREGLKWPQTRLSLLSRLDDQGHRELTAGASFARLEDINAIAWLLPIASPEVNRSLIQLQPYGDLHDLRLRYQETDSRPLWSASARGKSILSRPFRGLPGIDNLAFEVWMDQDQGSMQLESEAVGLQFPELFRAPLTIDRLSGQVAWQRQEDGGWQLSSKKIDARNRHITTESRLLLRLPGDPTASPFLDLQTDFRDGDGNATRHYLPTGIMSPNVVSWIDNSIIGGRVTEGSALFRGRLNDFPFKQKANGRFEVFFTIEDTTVDYQAGWPKLEKLTTKVRFLNEQMDAWASSGKILNSRIRSLHCRIDDLAHSDSLKLSGQAEGPLDDNLRLLREASPLKKEFATLVQGIQGQGSARLALDITLPTRNESDPIKLKGDLTLDNNRLHFDQQDLTLEKMQGHLFFDQDHLYTDNLNGQFMGSKVSFQVANAKGNGAATRVIADSAIPSTLLVKRFPDMPLLQQLKGTADWRIQVDIPHLTAGPDAAVPLTISSDLAGIAIDLPGPIGKAADQPQPFYLQTDLAGKLETPLTIRYGNLLNAALLLDNSDPSRPRVTTGDIQLGSTPARLPRAPGLQIQGHLQKLDLDPWIDLLKDQAGGVEPPRIRQLNLTVDQLAIGGTHLSPFTATLNEKGETLSGRISSNRFEGEIELPRDAASQPIRLALKRLDIVLDPETLPGPADAPASTDIDPSHLPPIEAQIEQVNINGKSFGALDLISQRSTDGWNIQKLTLKSPRLKLTASGHWRKTSNGQQKTAIDLAMESPALGQLLEDLKFAKNVDDSPATFRSQVEWPDTPLGFNRNQLNGKVSMQIGKGRFLNVNPGVGRIFGLLNLGALQRRLTLDFSDVFAKGFSFDNIEGDFLLDNGDAYTSNFTIVGPSSTIDITGRTGLASEDFDQLVTVTPRLSSSLTMAGALAGGPVVGAALYLAEKVVGKSFDRANKVQYLVSGPWEDPVFKREGGDEPAEPKNQEKTPPAAPLFN